jgi:hypothetical protein
MLCGERGEGRGTRRFVVSCPLTFWCVLALSSTGTHLWFTYAMCTWISRGQVVFNELQWKRSDLQEGGKVRGRDLGESS